MNHSAWVAIARVDGRYLQGASQCSSGRYVRYHNPRLYKARFFKSRLDAEVYLARFNGNDDYNVVEVKHER